MPVIDPVPLPDSAARRRSFLTWIAARLRGLWFNRVRELLTPKYEVFISYKHSTSRTFATELESALKTYARPLLRPPMRIFRDEKVIRTGDDLPRAIRTALEGSEYLILVASPAAAASVWVADEMRQWCGDLGRVDRLIIVLTDGEIVVDDETLHIRWDESTALPSLLRDFVVSLPVWADVRGMSEKDWSLENLRFSDVVNSIAARLRGVTPAEMNDRHVLQHRRNVRLRNAAVAAIALMLAVASATSILLGLSRQQLSQALVEVTRERNTSESRRLAGLATTERGAGRLELATLLAAEGTRFAETAEARSSLLAALERWAGKESVLTCADCEITEMAFRRTKEALPRALLAVGTARGDVAISDLAEGRPFVPSPSPLHRAAVNGVAFDPAGRLLASAGVGADGQVVLWKVGDAFDDAMLEPIGVYPGFGWAVAFSPDGRRLATARADGTVVLGDVNAEGVTFDRRLRGHKGLVFSLAFSPDGRRLAAGGAEGSIRIWDLADDAPALPPLAGHRGAIGRVAFSPDGRLLASAGHDGTVRLWDAVSGTEAGDPLIGHRDLVSTVAFGPDGATLVSGGRDGAVLVWDVASRKQIGEPLRGHRGAVTRALVLADVAPGGAPSLFDGSLVASAGEDGTVVLWRLDGRGQLTRPLSVGDAPVGAIAAVPGSIAVATVDEIRIFDSGSGALRGPVMRSSEDRRIAAVALSSDGRTLAAGDLSGGIQLWEATSGTPLGPPMVEHGGFVHALAFDPTTTRLASAGADGVVVWDVGARRPVTERLTDQAGDVYCVAYSPDGRWLATGARDGSIVVRAAGSLEALGDPLLGHLEGVTGLAFDRTSHLLTTGSFDGTIRLWQVPENVALGSPRRLAGAAITALALGPDGSLVAVGANDGTIALWDLAAGQVIGEPLRSHRHEVTALAFGDGGRSLISAADDGPAVWWTVDLAEWMAQAERLVHRNLRRDEWALFVSPTIDYRRTFPSLPDG